MRYRTRFIGSVLTALLAFPTQPAAANQWGASCAVILTFQFSTPVRATNTAPGYTITMAPAVDLDGSWAGMQPCVIQPEGDPFRTTGILNVTGQPVSWTCDLVVNSTGYWEQWWENRAGNPSPPHVFGFHVLNGTWGAWTMVVHNIPSTTFQGALELTVHPDDADAIDNCHSPTGIGSLKMIGVEVVRDP